MIKIVHIVLLIFFLFPIHNGHSSILCIDDDGVHIENEHTVVGRKCSNKTINSTFNQLLINAYNDNACLDVPLSNSFNSITINFYNQKIIQVSLIPEYVLFPKILDNFGIRQSHLNDSNLNSFHQELDTVILLT
jgi:hypothetical protein